MALVREGVLPYHVSVSLYRIALGFLLGTLVGVPVGLAMGLFRPVLILLEPYVQFFRFVPPVAWIIPAILWFGIGETSKIFLIFYTTVFLVLLNTMAGVAAVARNQIRSARCFGATRWQLFLWVSLPATMSRGGVLPGRDARGGVGRERARRPVESDAVRRGEGEVSHPHDWHRRPHGRGQDLRLRRGY